MGVTSNQRGNSPEWSYTSIQRAVLRSHPRVVQPGQAVATQFRDKKGRLFFLYPKDFVVTAQTARNAYCDVNISHAICEQYRCIDLQVATSLSTTRWCEYSFVAPFLGKARCHSGQLINSISNEGDNHESQDQCESGRLAKILGNRRMSPTKGTL